MPGGPKGQIWKACTETALGTHPESRSTARWWWCCVTHGSEQPVKAGGEERGGEKWTGCIHSAVGSWANYGSVGRADSLGLSTGRQAKLSNPKSSHGPLTSGAQHSVPLTGAKKDLTPRARKDADTK